MIRRLHLEVFFLSLISLLVLFFSIFFIVYQTTRAKLSHEAREVLSRLVLELPDQASRPLPNGEDEERRLPFFTVTVDETGNLLTVTGDYYDLSDEVFLEDLVAKTLDQKQLIGTLTDARLRYALDDNDENMRIIYLDQTNEVQTLRDLRRTLTLMGVIIFLISLIASLLLSRFVVRPVADALQAQSRFIADASHELKTPLTVILTNTDLLQNVVRDNPEASSLTEGIRAMATQMRGLVSGLLNLTRIDRNEKEIVKEPVDFSALVTKETLLFEPSFFENDLTLSQEIEDGLLVTGDAEQLRQLPEIFYDNALKYATPASTVKVRLASKEGVFVVFTVETAGTPLDAGEANTIFERFYRGDAARQMNASYGLGLSIAESIVKNHQGKISAEGRTDSNVFTIELPLLIR